MSDLLSVADVADRLSCSDQYARRLLKNGDLAGEKIGNTWAVRESAVEAYQTRDTVAEQVPDHPARKRKSESIKALSFFSGAMGMDLGLERAGIHVQLACEQDKACRATIQANRPDIALLGDIAECDAAMVRDAAGLARNEDIHLVVGGPPCQAFSSAGQRKGFEDTRGNVFLKYIELGLALRPQYLVIENVRGLLSAPLRHRPHSERGQGHSPLGADEQPGGALAHIIGMLEDAGYGVSFNLYNTANFGSPQIRERVIIIAARDGSQLPYLMPTHAQDGAGGLKKWRTFRDAVEGIIEPPEHVRFPEKRLKYYRKLSAGQNWRNLPVKLQKEALGNSYFAGGGKTGFLRRLAWERPSPTLVTHPAMPATDLCHPNEDRPLSIQEYKRIQEFPDDWHLAGSLIDRYRQVGNAVPLSLGAALGTLLMQSIRDEIPRSREDFRHSRYVTTDHVSWRMMQQRQLGLFADAKI
ncbi:MAG: DNA cytosine methyltransferase [Xanthomonadales bacterium]|nr:DNA cytosine methyltransferase [Xanthomonadales bacterium]